MERILPDEHHPSRRPLRGLLRMRCSLFFLPHPEVRAERASKDEVVTTQL